MKEKHDEIMFCMQHDFQGETVLGKYYQVNTGIHPQSVISSTSNQLFQHMNNVLIFNLFLYSH